MNAIGDSATMLWRQLLHLRRYPSLTLMLVALPIVFLLLFVYVFGGTLGNGLGGPTDGGRSAYANYVLPGILLMAISGAVQGTAMMVAMDMQEGIVARFRTMAIFRPSVLTGHVLGSLVQTAICLATVIGVGVLVGFRPTADAMEWLAAAGVLLMATLALVWLCIALGLLTRNVESASNVPMPLLLLPFLGSGFVPTDSMPAGLRWFAEHQPFTPVTETLRGLLLGTPIGDRAIAAVAWCAAITVLSFVWATRLYDRDPVARGA
jgi:ABC-2 type transport system permease protein